MFQSINTMMFAEGLGRRGREVRRSRCPSIGDDERQRDRPPDPQPWRVAAGRPCFLCRVSSTMLTGIACVVASRNQGRRARHKHHRIYGLEH
ncbi:hypothetical protein MYX75_04315 [Acidobacteria bacterium AH-259-A15]|nr:hypothetical protein [Acidobacteria bacterium AH-259-A15]